MKAESIAFVALSLSVIVGAIILVRPTPTRQATSVQNYVSHGAETQVEGVPGQPGAKQSIMILVNDGYSPAVIHARAGMPLDLKLRTVGTLDCSTALRIPSIGWSQHLPPTGEVAVQIPVQKAGVTVIGVCTMGMKSFRFNFD